MSYPPLPAVRPWATRLQACAFGLGLLAAQSALAQSPTASTQYQDDLKLCAEEKDSNARLQCRRDARAVYDKALAAEKAEKAKAAADKAAADKAAKAAKTTGAKAAPCAECGTVVSVLESERDGEASMIGTIAGGVGGAILGNQIGGGIGKDIATIAGAAGGAYAGRKIEEKVKAYKVWTVTVEYTDKSRRDFEFREDPQMRTGDAVRNNGSTIVRQ